MHAFYVVLTILLRLHFPVLVSGGGGAMKVPGEAHLLADKLHS